MTQAPRDIIVRLIKNGMSESEIASEVKVNPTTINRIRRGVTDPQFSTVVKLQELFEKKVIGIASGGSQ